MSKKDESEIRGRRERGGETVVLYSRTFFVNEWGGRVRVKWGIVIVRRGRGTGCWRILPPNVSAKSCKFTSSGEIFTEFSLSPHILHTDTEWTSLILLQKTLTATLNTAFHAWKSKRYRYYTNLLVLWTLTCIYFMSSRLNIINTVKRKAHVFHQVVEYRNVQTNKIKTYNAHHHHKYINKKKTDIEIT